MAVYRCNECDNYVDDDISPCSEDPRDGMYLLCPPCAMTFTCYWCGDAVDPEVAKMGMHKKCYLEGKGEHDYEVRRDERL